MSRLMRTLLVLLGTLLIASLSGYALPANGSGSPIALVDVGAEACPCEAPPCACQQPKREVVEAEEVQKCAEGKTCPQAVPACQKDNSCHGQDLVKAKTVPKVSGLGTVVVKGADGASGSDSEDSDSASASDDSASVSGSDDSASASGSDSDDSASASVSDDSAADGSEESVSADSSSDASASDAGEAGNASGDSSSDDSEESSVDLTEESSEESSEADATTDAAAAAAAAAKNTAAATGGASEDSTEDSSEDASEEPTDDATEESEESSEDAAEESSEDASSGADAAEESSEDASSGAAASDDSSEDAAEESSEDSSSGVSQEIQVESAESSEDESSGDSADESSEPDDSDESSDDASVAQQPKAKTPAQQQQQPKAKDVAQAASGAAQQDASGSSEESSEDSGSDEEASSADDDKVAADPNTLEALRAAKGAETAANQAAKSADKAVQTVAAQTEAINKQSDARKAEAIAAAAKADALKVQVAQKAKAAADKQLAEMKATLNKLQDAKVGAAIKSKEEREVDDEKAAQAALEKKRAAEKAEIQRLLSQLSQDKKEADKAEIKKQEDNERDAAKKERSAEETTKQLARKVVAAAKAEEEGVKKSKADKAKHVAKAKVVSDKKESDDAAANELTKKMAALLAQINADKAEAKAIKAKQDAEALSAAQDAKKKIAALEKQEEETKAAKKRVAEEGEKRKSAAEADTKKKVQAALEAKQAAAKKKAEAEAKEEGEKAAASKAKEEADKKAAKDAADLAAKKVAARKVEAAEQGKKAAAKAAAAKELAAQKAEMAKLKAQLMEQGQKMKAQIAQQAAKTAKMLADSKAAAKKQEEGLKTQAKNAAAELAAKQKAAEAKEEAKKASLKAQQAEAEKRAKAVAEKAAADAKAAKARAAAEATDKGKELKAKNAAKEAAVREREAAKKAEAGAKAALKAAAAKQAAEAKAKAAEAAKRAEAAAAAKKKAELAAKDKAAVERKAAAARKAAAEKAEALKKEQASKKVKEQAVKRLHGVIDLAKAGRPIGNGFGRPHYAVVEDGDLCLLQGAAHYDDVSALKAGQLNEFCRPTATQVFDNKVAHLAYSRLDVRADGHLRFKDVRLDAGARSSWATYSGYMFTQRKANRKRVQYAPHTYVQNYGGEYAKLSYYKKGDICVFEGMLRTRTNGFNPIMRLPDECRSRDGHIGFSVASNKQTARIYVHQNQHLYFHHRPGPSEWISLNGLTYFTHMNGQGIAAKDGWRGWGSGWRAASWRRQGRLCMLSGYLHNFGGHGFGLMGTLPAQCRPSSTLIFTLQQYHGHYQRYHVFPSGEVHWVEGHNHGGLYSLDGIRFVVDAPDFSGGEDKIEMRQEPLNGLADGYQQGGAAYRKPMWATAGDIVVVSGMVARDVEKKAGTKVMDLSIPAKYLPRTSRYFSIETPTHFKTSHSEVVVTGKGDASKAYVQWRSGTRDDVRAWFAMDGMVWARRGANLHSIDLSSYWEPAGDQFETPSVLIQNGLCVLNGAAVKRVRPHHDNHIGRLPVECRPADGRLYVPLRAGAYTERLEIHKNGHMYRYNDRTYSGVGRPRLANRVIFDGIVFPARAGKFTAVLSYMGPTGGVWRKPSYTIQDGLCVLSGSIYNSWPHHRRAMLLELPSDCRPSKRLTFGALSFGRAERVDVLPDGRVLHVSDRAGRYHVSLTGIVFKVDYEDNQHPGRRPMVAAKITAAAEAKALSRGVVEYGQGYQPITISVTGQLCQVNGRLRAGGLTRVLVTLPDTCRPAGVRYFNFAREGFRSSPVVIKADGTVRLGSTGGANDGDYVDINALFPVAAAKTVPLTLDGSWVDPNAGSASQTGFTRQGDMCVLDGYLTDILGQHTAFSRTQYRNGHTIFHLPEECRPQERAIFSGNHGKYQWRIDLLPDGRGHMDYRSGVQVKYLSISGIVFFVSSGHKLSLLHTWRGYSAQHHHSRYKHHSSSEQWFYRHPSWNKEGNICSLSGLLSSGGQYRPNRHIADVPAECRPMGHLRFSANNHQGPNRIEVRSDGQIIYIGHDDQTYVRHHWVSLEGITWVVPQFQPTEQDIAPPSKEGVELKLLNSFYPYTAMGQHYRRPMYTLVDKGVTVLSGAAAGADMAAVMADLPEKARPDKDVRFMVNGHDHSYTTYVAKADGSVVMGESHYRKGKLGYFSLDGGLFVNKHFRGRNGLVSLYRGFAAEDQGDVAPPRWHLWKDMCILSGTVKDAHNRNSHNSGLIGTLPTICRPKDGRLIFSTSHGRYNVRIDVLTNGQIHFVSGARNRRNFVLSGISFTRAANAEEFNYVPGGYYAYAHGYRRPGFTRTGNLCVLSGLFRNRGYNYGTIAVLPSKCRPRERLMFHVRQGGLHYVRLDVLPDGRLQWSDRKAGGSWLSVDGISFVVPSEDDVKFETILSPGKVTSDKAVAPIAPWRTDAKYSEPRVQMWGKLCLVSGVADAPSDFKRPMVDLPKECLPKGKLALSTRVVDSNVHNTMRYDLSRTGRISYVAGGGANREIDVSLQTQLIVPKGVDMMPLQLKNNWYPYGQGFEAPRFVKQGSFCILQGMLRLGSGTNNMAQDHWYHLAAQAPPGCKVKSTERLILHAGYHDKGRRLDIENGNIHVFEHGSTRHHDFVSLSGVFWFPRGGQPIPLNSNYRRYHGHYRAPTYLVEGGVCALSGSLVHNRRADLVVTLPPSCRPAKAMFFGSVYAGNHYQYPLTVFPDGRVVVRNVGLAYVSLDQIMFKVRQ